MKTIKEKWEFFENLVLNGVTDQQRWEARVAFYAGILSMLRMQMELAENKKMTEKEAAECFHGWMTEMEEFGLNQIKESKDHKPH